ncbi:xanthine dehydrogenase molybdopterin binding subunit [Rhodobacteraceae bacterium N5(2021)]|uniref:Aldehyde oxidoreductase molybdenum-binding subunit PaoC n=1 Tax=Gymnodinialimonas phycosphaerae TaxID=2841589 RepID=A0A975TVR6_9RHOB|nr:xanthine dehydrogenase molybdopterin binding subunit [Gymnodinialimonas phycosphaerae]MBY4894976.1 xanthine dehydrogenase molybdopterin binding subunit [Gymnodinialimonas phycosphaerae]
MSVHKPLPHDAARLHVTGAARYVDDIPTPPDCLHLAFGLSTVAKGHVTDMDLRATRSSAGVFAVVTGADLAQIPDCSPSNHDEPLLSDGTIHYAGQPLFLVAARSHLEARRAAALAQPIFQDETPILTIEEAQAANSRFEDGPRIYSKGDVDEALRIATHVVEGRLDIGGQEHFYLEGQSALALPQEGGDMVIHSSSQHPTEIQHKVADALGLPMHAVRVEVRRMGGGFGGKESQGNHLAIACAIIAAQTGRPCKMRYDRDDDFIITGKRHDATIDYRAGFDADGRLVGVDFTQHIRCGWAMDLSLPVADRAMLHADNAYLLPAARITSHRWKTNTQSATAFRGFGGPQGMVGIERVMDHAAHQLGIEPLALRRLNYYREAPLTEGRASGGSFSGKMKGARLETADLKGRGAVRVTSEGGAKRFGGAHSPVAGGQTPNTTPYGMEVEDFLLNEMTERLAEQCDYTARVARVDDWNAREPVLKRGIALTPVKFGISFTLTHLNQAGALVHVYQDGSIHLNHGGTEMGQGLFQKVAQVAAHRFGVAPERVKITATDTGKVPNTSATAASSGTDLNGMAVQAACDKIRKRIAEGVAAELHAEPADITFEDGLVRSPTAEMPFDEAVQRAYMARISLSATGFYKTPKIAWDRLKGQGRPFLYFAYGAACSEVVIDTLTGENRILRTDILHDAGASLNPALDIGQIEGGFVQGAGWLTMEELVWDAKGALKTHAPSTYKIPCASDAPDIFNVSLYDAANREDTIYRSKAVGEPPFMLGISVFSALSHACASAGANFPDLQAPATPEAILAAVGRARA